MRLNSGGSRGSRAESLASALIGENRTSSVYCGMALSGNAKSLIVMTALFTIITASQYIAAIIANSIALQADCASMLVDALSYVGNLFAECSTDKDKKAQLELSMSFVSLALLVGFTIYFMLEAVEETRATVCFSIHRAAECTSELTDDTCEWTNSTSDATGDGKCGELEEVNPFIVIGFAAAGLVFDVASLVAYRVWTKPSENQGLNEEGEERKNVNMLSALLHVLSDLARSTTTLIEGSILLIYTDVSGARIDGWSALIVCSLIAAGALGAIASWVAEARLYFSERKKANDCDCVDLAVSVEGATSMPKV